MNPVSLYALLVQVSLTLPLLATAANCDGASGETARIMGRIMSFSS